MAEEVKETGQGAASKNGGKKKLLIFLIIGLLIIGIAGGLVIFLTSKKGREGKKYVKKEVPEPAVLYNLDPIVVNLFDPTGKRYIQIRLALALADKKAEEEIKNKEPIIKDAIITYLSAKTPEEVIQPEAKEVIKKDLLKKINEALGEDWVLEVYITQYIVE